MQSENADQSSPSLVTFLFHDLNENIQVLQLCPNVQVHRATANRFVLEQRAHSLPAGFFGTSISSITALVGRNSSGKSTALADIARVLCGARPVTQGYVLILRQQGRLFQLRDGMQPRIFSDGAEVELAGAEQFLGLNVVYFSASFDPLSRPGTLLESISPVQFTDISSQNVYSRRGDDFDDKLAYLQGLGRDGAVPLELSAERARQRSISFTATIAYDPDHSAQTIFRHLLESLTPETLRSTERLAASLSNALDISIAQLRSEVLSFDQTRGALRSDLFRQRRDWSRRLWIFFDQMNPSHPLTRRRTTMLLGTGRIAAMVEQERRRKKPSPLDVQLLDIILAPDDAIDRYLGQGFLLHANTIAAHADWFEDTGNVRFTMTVGPGASPAARAKSGAASGHDGRPRQFALLDSFIALRRMDVDFSVDFHGLSDGQRSLLTFAARYAAQEERQAWQGNTLLLVDEHEQGLHPEWQRQFIKHLCELIDARTRTLGKTQVILSSHSPFVISDLPNACVNIVGGSIPETERTFGGNLLDLLLSPLFMERTTGEFAVEKVQKWLGQIKKSRNVAALEAMRSDFELVGDSLLRSYLDFALDQRLAALQTNRRPRLS
jgi:energy-coupling factor transporter ATP-binding protein EcfA2